MNDLLIKDPVDLAIEELEKTLEVMAAWTIRLTIPERLAVMRSNIDADDIMGVVIQ